MSGGAHRLVLDRREGEYVVVEVDGGTALDLPAWFLPPQAREGDVLVARAGPASEGGWRIEIRVDADATAAARDAARQRLERLAKRDPGGDVTL